MGWILMLAAAALFFLGGVESMLIPRPMIWGLFCMALGLCLGGYLPWRFGPRPPP
jgi:hypothetical protein